MQNSWNDAKPQIQKRDTIDSVIDAFKDIVPADAILGSGWQSCEKKKGGYETKAKSGEVASISAWGEDTISATSNQEESENSWNNSWGNSSSWDNNSGWGNEDNNRSYSTNNTEYQNSAYADDREDINKATDAFRPNPGISPYTDNRERYQDVNKATDARKPNQINNFNMYTNNDNFHEYNNQAWSERSQSPQQQHSYPVPPSPSESDTSTDQNSETIDLKERLSAWHNLVEPNAREREDGIGGGQLHRRGKNFIPLDEATVLAIQQKGGNKKSRKEKPIPSKARNTQNIPQSQIGKPPIKPSQKSATPLKQSFPSKPYIPNTDTSQKPPASQKTSNTKVPVKTQNQRQNTQPIHPNRTQQQTQQKPSPLPSQTSQSQPPWDVPKSSSRERSQQSQQPQQPQQSQQSQQPQKLQNSWDTQLVNEPFWEIPSTPPTVQNQSQSNASLKQVITNQSQPLRQQSPTRSPRPTKSVQNFNLPYIPPEFDSTPYRNQPSPPVCDTPNGYDKPVTNEWGDNKVYDKPANKWRDNKVYEQDYDVDDQRNEYYESDVEEQEDKFDHSSDYNDRHKEPEKNLASRVNHHDRGQLLLTINVELETGKTQAIEVHVNDDPLDLAKEFCDSWKVTNPVVMPALECLIREEKEKRLGNN